MQEKLILDVDTGIDDALGIMLAVKSGHFDILGITTVCGNVSLEAATENTCKILDLLGTEHIPVVRGASKPLMRRPHYEHRVHGEDGLGGALRDVTAQTRPAEGFAPDFIIEQAARFKGEVTLVMTGPLTNLALAVMKHPGLVSEVKRVIFMGGVVRNMGNVTPTAEFNAYADPEAMKIVVHAGFPSLTMVGLDVTRQALLTDKHIQMLGNTPIARYVRESTALYMRRYYERNGVQACALHDPLAVGVALNSSLVSTKKFYVDVETKSELCDGKTICDFQNRLGNPANVDVCLEVDSRKFLQMFTEVLQS
ncbi:nucleoside hydrolase [Brevibacillus fulvus]|uniref:Purine nucleosidase n=1 Tax=Brevibacillus fulvus TaxID=1125967 RepID=A0A938XUG5_9BACL|nr:nucleoside hydrolase [Brevibacillus fulvus]MBM7590317.1 purine nucleosidase [Brevibacillus fulvus]